MGAASAPNSSAGQDNAKQRIMALDLIQKHAGSNAREGQKSKWIVDLVMRVDEEYRQDMAQQRVQIAELQQQLAEVQSRSNSTTEQLTSQVHTLQGMVRDQEVALTSSGYALRTAQEQYMNMQEALRCAEDAAATAATECSGLIEVVQGLLNQQARVRSIAAHRASALRESLQHTHSALRRTKDKDRSAQDEREVRLRGREQVLAVERAALLQQQSVHAARDEALETLQLKYHLSVCKVKELLRSAAEQADSAVAAATSGSSQLPHCVKAGAVQGGRTADTAANGSLPQHQLVKQE